MPTAKLTDHHDGTATLRVETDRGQVLADRRIVAPETGPNRGSVMGHANRTLPELGYELDYGWMSERTNDAGETVHSGRVVRLGERTSVWD